MATLKTIGRKIAQERLRQGLSQEDLAGIAEIDRSFLSTIENGKKNFSIQFLFNICRALNLPPADLFK
ncbi:MAG: helix-turn-helix transcriptional regulator [bacterium]|nr:helix-turn-helix transcriptional regulator [bacterium]